jgi:uncharacterized membrane protein
MTEQPSPPADEVVDSPDEAAAIPVGDDAAAPAEAAWRRIARLEFIDGFVAACRGWLLWFSLVGVAPGLALWPILHRDDPKFKLANARDHLIEIDLTWVERVDILEYAILSLCVTGIAYGAFGWLHRRKHPKDPWSAYFGRLNTRLVPVMLLPLISALITEELEVRLQLLTLALALIVGLAMAYWHYQTADMGWRAALARRLDRLQRQRVPDVLMLVLVVAYGGYFGWLSVLDHHNLGTHIYDLALYDNTFWNTVNGETMACSYLRGNTHISAHVDPIIILLSPIYALNPRAETLLWLQAGWIAMGGIPLYLHAKRMLDSGWQALVVLLLLFLAPALHGINMFDFHSLALMIPLVMWAVYLLDIGKLWAYWVVIPLLLLTREDMPFVCWFIAVYAIMIKRRRTGVLTLIVATVYLVAVKMKTNSLLAGDKDGYSYSYYYEEMIPDADEGLPGLVVSTFSDPIAALAVFLKPEKLLYWGKVFLPLLFIPLFGRGKRVLYLYGLAFIGLVSRKHVFSVHFQYSSVLLPFLLMGFPDGLARLTQSAKLAAFGIDGGRLRRALLMGALATTVVISSKFGAIVPNKIFRAGWNRLEHSQSDKNKRSYKRLWALIDKLPQEASVCSNSTIGPHVSNRVDASKWPACSKADYILVPTKGLKKKDARMLDRLRKRKDYDIVEENEEFILMRKLSPEEVKERRGADKSSRKRPTPKRPSAKTAPKDDADDDLDDAKADNPYEGAEGGDDEADDADSPRSRRPAPRGREGKAGEDTEE